MSTAQLPVDRERIFRELEQTSEAEQQQIAETVTQIVAAGPADLQPEVPDLLDMRGFLREDGDDRERPGTEALLQSRQQDKEKHEAQRDRLSSDE